VYEIILDIRKESQTFLEWEGIELNESNYRMLFVPKGFALAFQTLEDETEIFYQMTQKYMPEYAIGIRWDDPKLKIEWPLKPTVISQKDKSWELL
jgi:dTDP-4-dehydrorhamnose 3,5-epimerase